MPRAKVNDIDKDANGNIVVNTQTLASILGIGVRHLYTLCDEGVIKRTSTGKGKFPLIQSVKDYINYIQVKSDVKEAKVNDPKQKYDIEHALLEQAKREKAEIQLNLMKGTTYAAEDVEREMIKMLSACRARLLAIPTKLAPRIVIQNDTSKVETMLRNEVHTALQELSEYDPTLFKHKTTVENTEDK